MTNNHMQPLPSVFVVDDETAIIDAFKGLLGIWNIRVQTYFSAKIFLESYRDEWTGCLIVDHCMPGMNGIELLKELRHRGSTIPCILMTGNGDAQSRQRAIDAGAASFLEKPFRSEQLKEIIERQCPELFGSGKKVANRA